MGGVGREREGRSGLITRLCQFLPSATPQRARPIRESPHRNRSVPPRRRLVDHYRPACSYAREIEKLAFVEALRARARAWAEEDQDSEPEPPRAVAAPHLLPSDRRGNLAPGLILPAFEPPQVDGRHGQGGVVQERPCDPGRLRSSLAWASRSVSSGPRP